MAQEQKSHMCIMVSAAFMVLTMVLFIIAALSESPHLNETSFYQPSSATHLSTAAPSKERYCSEFIRRTSGCGLEEWVGIYRDLFSPDDEGCPDSLRYIDLNRTTGELQVSASGTGEGCAETWGRRFDKSTRVNPVVLLEGDDCQAQVSFITKVPPEAPAHKYAEKGALNFTLTLGCLGSTFCADSERLIEWNGMYNGQGGAWFDGQQVVQKLPSDCDNFWSPPKSQEKTLCGLEPHSPVLVYDMHDGDTKTVTLSAGQLLITPGDGSKAWSTTTLLNQPQCNATVDFNVPNKPNPPPVNLTATFNQFTGGAGGIKLGVLFNDRTGTVAPVGNILNAWLPAIDLSTTDSRCPFQWSTVVFKDMVDGDQKQIHFEEVDDEAKLTITPYANKQSWTTTAAFDKKRCSALVDFNVAGKPNPPPVKITATLYTATANQRLVVVFNDYTGTIGTPSRPLNAWIQV